MAIRVALVKCALFNFPFSIVLHRLPIVQQRKLLLYLCISEILSHSQTIHPTKCTARVIALSRPQGFIVWIPYSEANFFTDALFGPARALSKHCLLDTIQQMVARQCV